MWSNFFKLCFTFIQQPGLQLENFSLRKQLLILDHCSDMRLDMAEIMVDMWNCLGKSTLTLLVLIVRKRVTKFVELSSISL